MSDIENWFDIFLLFFIIDIFNIFLDKSQNYREILVEKDEDYCVL